MTSKKGARQTYTLSSTWHRIDHNCGRLSTKHWTPTGASSRNEEEEKEEEEEEDILIAILGSLKASFE